MMVSSLFVFFKQKTAYEMRISDWSSDVCSSDLEPQADDQQRTRVIELILHCGMPDRQRVSRQSCAQRVRTERTECHAQETVQRANRQPRIHAASTTRKRIPRSCSLAISASPIACAGVTKPEMFGSLSNATDRDRKS